MAYNGPFPQPVKAGCTGDASFTAYSVVCGGTSSTGNLQNVSGVGSANQVLASNGAGALPSWQSISVLALQTNIQVFTGSGTYTPTANMSYCIVECVGGGGGGGGANQNSPSVGDISGGGGGGAGAYVKAVFSSASIGASATVTIGSAGAGGASGNHDGSNGSATTFVGTSANISADFGRGGTGGDYNTLPASVGGAGGSSSTCSGQTGTAIILPGSDGGSGYHFLTPSGCAISGNGAGSFYGAIQAGTVSITTGNVNGQTGLGYGSGGSGGASISANTSGGNGTAGLVIVTEYIV